MSPYCQNCDEWVSEDYVRVFSPAGLENPRVCPRCEDKIREGADVRDARSPRYGRNSDEKSGGEA